MATLSHNSARGSFGTLKTLLRRQQPEKTESCELCSGAIFAEHQHLLELGKRKIVCACDACAVLFTDASTFRRVPRQVRFLRDFVMDDHQWDSLLIPISLAFFFHNSAAGRVLAYYPSPAGATESLLDLEYWQAIAEANPVLNRMEKDVEALLVNRVGQSPEYYLAPIDHCYRLVGLIRTHWSGFSGGTEVWKQIAGFFTDLKQLCPGEPRA